MNKQARSKPTVSEPVLFGQRLGGHLDQRNPRGAGTLRGTGAGGPASGLGPAHTQTQTARDLGLEHGADYRLTNSLFMEWRSHQPMAKYKTTTDFHPIMGENNLAKAMRFVTNKRPCL